MFKRIVSLFLILLHLATFGPLREALAAGLESEHYRLTSSAATQGGGVNRRAPSGTLALAQDALGEPFTGIYTSASYKYELRPGLVPTFQPEPPISIKPIPALKWEAGQPAPEITLEDYFLDPGGEGLSYNFTYLSSPNQIGVNISEVNKNAHQASFTTPAAGFGASRIIFTATNSYGESVQSNEALLEVSRKPTLLITRFQADSEIIAEDNNNEFFLEVTCRSTAEGEVGFTYTTDDPPNIIFQEEEVSQEAAEAEGAVYWHSRTIWRAAYPKKGRYNPAIQVTAQGVLPGLKSTSDKTLSVLVKNHPLKITSVSLAPPGEIFEGQKIIITPTAEDQDQDEITYNYHADKPNANAKINHTGPSLLWLTDYEDAGDYLITITASDGTATATQTIPLKITNKNRAPEAEISFDKYNLSVNETLYITLKILDPDGDDLTYVLYKDGVQFASGSIKPNQIIDITTSFSTSGRHEISAKLTDTGGLVSPEAKEYAAVIEVAAADPVLGDFNGDSRSDLGLYYYKTGEWQIYLVEKGTVKIKSPSPWLSGFGASDSHDFIAVGGDFNGDAKSDIGIYNYKNGQLRIGLSTGSSFSAQAAWLTFSLASDKWQPFSGNFNADRFTDFGLYNKETGEVRIALGTGSGFAGLSTWLAADSSNKDCSALSGDFNGDSLGDLCLFKKSEGTFKVAFSNNREFKDLSAWLSNYATNKDLIISDFNNDGLTDVGYWDKPSTWRYAISTGATFKDSGAWLSDFGASTDTSVTTADFDGNGITDAACFDPNQKGTDAWKIRLSTNKPADLLTDVNVGGGKNGKTKVEYGYAAEEANNQLPFPVYVAKKVSSIDILPLDQPQESYNQVFDYSDGYFDAQEREFRGFGTAKVTDPLTNNYTITEFYQGRPQEDGALKGQIKKLSAYDGNIRDQSGQLVSETINKYEVKKGGPAERFLGFPALIEQSTKAWEENRDWAFTRGSTEYDSIGNPLKSKEEEIKVSVGNKVREIGRKSYSETVYYPGYAAGFNRPQASYLKDKDGNILSEKSFKYNEQGNLKQETLVITNPLGGRIQARQNVYVYYDYDPFGNLITTTNAKGAKTTTDYESTFYTFPQRVVNHLGHTISYEYDPRFGAATKVTDPNKHTSETIYDDLGRVITVKNVNQEVVTEYAYPDFNTKITKQAGLFTIEHIDGLGRKYKSESSGEDGAASRRVASETYYNVRGQVASESIPHYIDEDPAKISYIRYEYDTRGRIKRTVSDFTPTKYPPAYPVKVDEHVTADPTDAESLVNYINPLYTETIDPENHKKGALKDGYGNITEVNEFIAGEQGDDPTTTYKYDLQNNLTETQDRKRNITKIFYDSAGRKLKMNDPDMGEWSYEYDLLGNLLKQTDAKNQVLEFEYDALNRLTKKTRDDGRGKRDEVNYVYDDPPEVKENCIGRLSKIIDQSGSSEFFYDNLGREVKSIKTIADSVERIAYSVEREYDISNRLTKLTYPDDEVVQYGYDTNSGLLERVYTQENEGRGKKDEGREYVKDITYNAKGQIKAISYGNGVATNYDYGSDLRLSHILTQKGQNPSLQNLYYYFDKNGNLKTLTDNLRNNIRTYDYDGLDRLIGANNTPIPNGSFGNLHFKYDSIGNMIDKSGVGAMQYRKINAGPHAVTDAGGYSYRYDANGNMTVGKNKTLEYDAENRLTQVAESGTTTSFTYDGDGGRVRKTRDEGRGTKDETTYIGSLFEIQVKGQGSKVEVKHIFAGSQRVCSVTKDEGRGTRDASYYHSDHLGSSSVITDSSGNQVERYEYTPYGTIAISEIVPRPSSFIPRDTVHHKFTGKELDSTGLYYYGARYYDPEIGRFITPDTIVQAPYDPQSLNRYSYCRNNPINLVDPSGHLWWFVIPMIIGAIIGGVSAGIQSDWNPKAMLIGAAIGAFSGVMGFGAAGMTSQILGRVGSAMFGGMVGGATAGMLSSAYYGGDILRGTLMGAGLGALGGLAFGAFSQIDVTDFTSAFTKVSLYAATGGGLSKLGGGEFWQGAVLAGTVALSEVVYKAVLSTNDVGRKDPDPSMDTAELNAKPKMKADGKNYETVLHEKNVAQVGTAYKPNTTGLIQENAGWLQWIAKNVPGIQGTARFHDLVTYAYGRTPIGFTNGLIFNVPSMPPAFAITVLGSAAATAYSPILGQFAIYGED